MDRLCRLTASLKTQKHKIQSNILKNIFKATDHQHKDTGVVNQLTETAIFIATPMKKQIWQFISPVRGQFFCQFADKQVAGSMPKYPMLPGYTNLSFYKLIFFLAQDKNK